MLFYLGLLSLIAGIVFAVNGTEWFSGENNLAVPLAVIGVVLIALTFVLQALVLAAFKRASKRMDRSFRSF
jgi:mannose/fructose/N-acetylgalactosamine-specific phosphotransferase system component IIC